MATSGTVGRTTFSFANILTQAMRRCRLNPSVQTAELVEAARTGLYLVFTSLANRGLNLWRLEHGFLSVIPGQIKYSLPSGSIRVANLNFVSNTADTTAVLATVTGGYSCTFPEAALLSRVGIKFDAEFTGELVFRSTPDGAAWLDQGTSASTTYEANRWYWFELSVTTSLLSYTVTSSAAFTLTDATAGRQTSSVPLWPWNRDEYSLQPFRTQSGRPSTIYLFDRQRAPVLWIWPNPTGEYDYLEYWIHRQIEDIDLLTEEIDVPLHWMNAAVWLMAREICLVEPKIDPAVVPIVMAECDRVFIDAEMGESDGSSTYVQPRIGVYTR